MVATPALSSPCALLCSRDNAPLEHHCHYCHTKLLPCQSNLKSEKCDVGESEILACCLALCSLDPVTKIFENLKKYLNLPKIFGPTTQGPTDLLVPGVDVSAGLLLQLEGSGGGPVVESVPPQNLGLGPQLGA